MFKKLNRDMDDIKMIQITCLQMKTMMSEIENVQDGTKDRLDIAGDKISKLEDIPLEAIQNAIQRETRKHLKKRHLRIVGQLQAP